MTVKPRTLLVLLVLVAGLGAFVWLKERKMPSSTERVELGKRLFGSEEKDVTALVLEVGSTTVRLEREAAADKAGSDEKDEVEPAFPSPGRWSLTTPLAAPADGAEVSRVLGSVLGLEKQRTLEDFDPAELGLASPRARVTVETTKQKKTMVVGAQVPQSDSMVVTLEGSDEAFVVPSFVFADLGKAPGDWRDKALVRGQRDEVESVRLIPEVGPQLLLAKRNGEFWLESPITDRAARDVVDRLLTDLTALKATSFVDEPKPAEELGLAPPAGTFQVQFAGAAQPVVIAVGALRHVRVDERLALTDTDLLPYLGKPLSEWRSLAWSGLDSWQVESVTVEDQAGKLELRREGGNWLRDGVEVPYTPVGDFLAAISEAKAESVGEVNPLFSGKAPLTLTLKGKEEKSETLGLFEAIDGTTPAVVSSRPVTLQLPASAVEEIRTKLADLRAAQPAAADEPAVDESEAADEPVAQEE